MTDVILESGNEARTTPLRIGVVGAGTASHSFVRALAAAGIAEVTGLYATEDPRLPAARQFSRYENLLDDGVSGVIIATPTSEHLEQAEAAIARGIAVFCQRPLGRNAEETRHVIDAARRADVLLGVDMTFRAADAMRVLHSTVQAGELGDIYAVDAIYHSASGPVNAWAADPQFSGGGVVIDAGISMIDLSLWTLGFPRVTAVSSRLFARGERITRNDARPIAEDYATALLDLDTGITINLSCGWHMSAGQGARIELTFHGTESAGTFRNVDGSLERFTSELFRGSHRHTLAAGADDWIGRTAVSWATMLSRGGHYDPWVEGVADVAAAVDHVRSGSDQVRGGSDQVRGGS
jgi:predicted dehydrogenase